MFLPEDFFLSRLAFRGYAVMQAHKLKLTYESFMGAISSTTMMKAYKPYRKRVTVTLKRQLASGWVNAYDTKTTAISSITDPMALKTFFFMRGILLVKFRFGEERVSAI